MCSLILVALTSHILRVKMKIGKARNHNSQVWAGFDAWDKIPHERGRISIFERRFSRGAAKENSPRREPWERRF